MTVRDAATARTVAAQGSAARHLEFDLDDDYFAPQPTRSAELPDPEQLLRNLAHCVLESFAGARDLEQLARWVTDDVYRALSKRVVLAARARRVKGQQAQRPSFAIGRVHLHEPAEGVIEAVVMVHHRVRSRAVAIRLEGFDRRWRASAVSVL